MGAASSSEMADQDLTCTAQGLDWIELILGFDCNCRCRVCPSSVSRSRSSLSLDQVRQWLEHGRRRGAHGVWFGGGEPTLFPELVRAVEAARDSGYERIRLQSNGMRFSYPAYSGRLAGAGLTEVSLSIKGVDAASHDRITRVPGSFDHLLRATRSLSEVGVTWFADVLLSADSMRDAPEIVKRFHGLGAQGFTFWLMSLHGLDVGRMAPMVPRLSEVGAALNRAFDAADALDASASSLHTPPCVLAPAHRDKYIHAGRYALLVVVPGGPAFMAEESPMEGGSHVLQCETCSARENCLGLRQDYLSVHGGEDLVPL